MIVGFLKKKFAQMADLPIHYRVIGAAAIASPLIRTVTTPYMFYDIYTDIEMIEGKRSMYAVWAAGQVQEKLALHGAVWAALQAVQWGGLAYVGHGIRKANSPAPAESTP